MDLNYQPQLITNHFLKPFIIASDCPQENRKLFIE